MLDVVEETLAVRETTQQERLSAVRAFGFALFYPGAETVMAGQLTARGAHPGFLHILEADVALQERGVLTSMYSLHIIQK